MKQQVTTETIEEFLASSKSISGQQILKWMRSDDIQVQAGIVLILSEHGDQVSPPLEPRTEFEFCLGYYKRCLLENPPDGKFTANRTIEGDALQKWFKALWSERQVNEKLIARAKELITEVYKSGDNGAKYAVETAVLEHLFEDSEIAPYFSDWENDLLLGEAYSRAKQWGDDHDTTSP